MKTIWIVHGSCGEYEDERTWIVAACETEGNAELLRCLAQLEADEIFVDNLEATHGNKYDKNFSSSGRDFKTEYWVEEVKIVKPEDITE